MLGSRRAIDEFRVVNASSIAKRRSSLRRREHKRQRKTCKYSGGQQRAESCRAKRTSGNAAKAKSAEQKNKDKGNIAAFAR
jgi:hypothetical protein